jgi:pimeloyl-ACP methyl ester carboxylesterase
MSTYQGVEQVVDLGHIQLRGKLWGPSDGYPTLALHGWLDNAASFDYLAPKLDEHLVFAVDLPGHGLSDHLPDGANYHLLDSVGFLFQALEQLQWQRPIIMGHSLGGALATLMASSMPEKVGELILLDALGPLSEEITQGPQRLGLAVKKIMSASMRGAKSYPSQVSMIRARMDVNGLSNDAARALVLRGSRAVEQGFKWRFDPRLLLPSLLYFSEDQVLTFLQQIESPALLICADGGIIINNPLLARRIAQVKKITHTVVKGHHHLQMDSSAEVAKVIKAHINK